MALQACLLHFLLYYVRHVMVLRNKDTWIKSCSYCIVIVHTIVFHQGIQTFREYVEHEKSLWKRILYIIYVIRPSAPPIFVEIVRNTQADCFNSRLTSCLTPENFSLT